MVHFFCQKDIQDAKKNKKKKKEFLGSAQDNNYVLLETLVWLLRNAYSSLSQTKQELEPRTQLVQDIQ